MSKKKDFATVSPTFNRPISLQMNLFWIWYPSLSITATISDTLQAMVINMWMCCWPAFIYNFSIAKRICMYLHVSTYPGVSKQTTPYWILITYATGKLHGDTCIYRYLCISRCIYAHYHVRSWPLTLIIKVHESLYIYICMYTVDLST
jgi:hypothetical protein